ncbi:MAG: hypothetical protein ACO1RT_04845 [Planctomycetaceae bacterium]
MLIAPALGYADASSTPSYSICQPRDPSQDRIWLISTRSLAHDACCAQLDRPAFHIARIDHCGTMCQAALQELVDERDVGRPVLIQIHGNRMTDDAAIERGLFVYRHTMPHCDPRPLDYVIFSWPSDREGILINDGREKAERTDAQGLYLSWLLREFVQREIPVAMIGFSFGGRIATGATHALAGGALGGRRLPAPHLRGADVSMGLIAPALEDDWLRPGNYHGLASQNTQNMSILYNRRDAVLKRYWLIDRVRGDRALGYTGPRAIAPRVDGTPMPVAAHDCSLTLGIRHDEKKYYLEDCRAGVKMAKLLQTTF